MENYEISAPKLENPITEDQTKNNFIWSYQSSANNSNDIKNWYNNILVGLTNSGEIKNISSTSSENGKFLTAEDITQLVIQYDTYASFFCDGDNSFPQRIRSNMKNALGVIKSYYDNYKDKKPEENDKKNYLVKAIATEKGEIVLSSSPTDSSFDGEDIQALETWLNTCNDLSKNQKIIKCHFTGEASTDNISTQPSINNLKLSDEDDGAIAYSPNYITIEK